MNSLIILVDNVIYLYSIVLIINIILSWLTAFNVINTQNRFVYIALEASYKLTDPVLNHIEDLYQIWLVLIFLLSFYF